MQNPVDVNKLYKESDYWGWVPHDGFKMFLGKNDCGVAMRLRAGIEYEPTSMKLWGTLCEGSAIAVDIGAHTGIYSLAAFRHGAESVCSIEPYYMNNARLDMNLRANGFKDNGVVLACALDTDGHTKLSVRTKGGYCTTGGSITPRKKATGIYTVQCVRLDSLIDESFHAKVGPIKIDVEGCAARVLAGMPKILSYKPDLLIEVTEKGLTEILKPYGYRFSMLDEEGGITDVESLEPALLPNGKPDMRRLNRWCH